MKKILITNRYGAGWSSWCSNEEVGWFMLMYQPIIDFLENGGKFTSEDCRYVWSVKGQEVYEYIHPILEKLLLDIKTLFYDYKDNNPYLGGCQNLTVEEWEFDHSSELEIEEHDGLEKVKYSQKYWDEENLEDEDDY